jgi:hypothetical protein
VRQLSEPEFSELKNLQNNTMCNRMIRSVGQGLPALNAKE